MVPMAPVITVIMWGPGRATVPSGPGQALSQGLLPRGRGPAVEEGRGRLGPSLPAPRGPAGAAIGHGARARTLPWRPRAAGCSSQRTGSSQQEGTEKAQTQSPQSPSVWTSQSPHRPVVAPFLVPRPRGGGGGFVPKPCPQGSGTPENTSLCCSALKEGTHVIPHPRGQRGPHLSPPH